MTSGCAEQLFEAAALGPVMLRNRVIKAATRGDELGTHCVLVDPADRPGLRVLRPGPGH